MSHQLIPLTQLVVCDANVRRTDRKADLDSLVASIKAHGLLQNLSVRQRDETHFEVVAGARRHAALKALAKQGHIARDFPVPCHLVSGENAGETSLAENVQRVAMNAMDEAEAFAALSEENFTLDAIAERFGVSNRHVEQRLALASLSAKVKAAYRRGDLNLDAARAFCIEPDHGKQDAALKVLGKPITHAGDVRALLTQGTMKASDRIARFVGLEDYELAGGALTRDLFDHDTVIVADPHLMTRLANDKLDAAREGLLAQGWGWVETGLANTGLQVMGRRIHPRHRAMNRAEKKSLRELDAKIEALDEALGADDVEDADPRFAERDDLECKRDALMAALVEWNKDEIALAGAVVGVDYSGRLSTTLGIVRKADEKALKQLAAQRTHSSDTDGADAEAACIAAPASPRQTSKVVSRELTSARANALKEQVAANIDVGLAVAACAIAHAWRDGRATGIDLAISAAVLESEDVLHRRRLEVLGDAPEDDGELLPWCLAQDHDRLVSIIALGTAYALDLAHEANGASDDRKQRLADTLAEAVDLDMRQHWQADLGFWSRLSKPVLMQAIETAPSLAKASPSRRETQLKAHAKLKRDDLAKLASRLLKNSGWLPDVLIAPAPAGALALTPEGESEAAAIAAQ